MSRLSLLLVLLLCCALVLLPLWASWNGVGEARITKKQDGGGSFRYVGSRGWMGGGPSGGK